jgi:hypothetical protein
MLGLLRSCLPPPSNVLPDPTMSSLKIQTRRRVRDLALAIGLVLLAALPLKAEPYSPSCETALEKLHKAREALVPYRRTMELARARERGAYGEIAICTGGGTFSAKKALRCEMAIWQAPERTKKVIDAEGQYLQGRYAFEELFERAKQTCLLEP